MSRSSIIVESTVIRPPHSPPPPNDTSASPPSSPKSSKRPLSPAHDDQTPQNGKRRRLSTDVARGRRMMGALMGTLSSFKKQTSSDSKLAKQVERRAEIDARVKEKAEKEKEVIAASRVKEDKERREREEEAKMKLERETVRPRDYSANPSRICAGVFWNRANLKTRLRNDAELAKARHLHTEATPRIYYRPYLLTPSQ